MKPFRYRTLYLRAVIGLIAVGFASAPNAQAADRYWDTSAGSGNGVGGSGTWTSSSTTWSTTSTGDATLVTASQTADALIFQGMAGNVIFGGSLNAASLAFNTTGYTFASNATSRNLQGPIALAAGVNLTFTSTINGGGLGFNSGTTTISGTTGSTLTLDNTKGAFTFDLRNFSSLGSTAPITITASGSATSTTIGNSVSLGSINAAITNNSSIPLTLSSSRTSGTSDTRLVVNGRISGSQGVIFSAGTLGRVELGNTNDYAGETRFTGIAGADKSTTVGLVKLNVNNAISTISNVVMGHSNGTGENLDLAGKNQTLASLTSNVGGTGIIFNSSTTTSTLTINGAATAGSFGLAITDGADSTRKVALTRAGSGTTTLTGTNSYTGTTNVTSGKLIINGDNSAATGAVTVGTGGTLGGTGTVGGATTINGTLAPGVASTLGGVGTQTFSKGLNHGAGSIFEWDLKTAAIGTAGTDFDAVTLTTAAGSLSIDPNATTGSIFKIVLGETYDGSSAFWSGAGQKTWNVFAATDSAMLGSNTFSRFQLFDSTSPTTPVEFASYGSFGFTNTGSTGTLTWTAVPEATSALAGVLLSAGLLRRRRN